MDPPHGGIKPPGAGPPRGLWYIAGKLVLEAADLEATAATAAAAATAPEVITSCDFTRFFVDD